MDVVGVWNDIAVDLAKRGKLAAACASMRRAVDLAPDRADLRSNYGNMLRRAGRPVEAGAELGRALELDPVGRAGLFNMGCWLQEQGFPLDGVEMFDAVLASTPGDADVLFARATALLQAADWRRGFAEYDVRLEQRAFGGAVALWDGSPLAGRTLFLHAEQGLGDTIMFHRFASVLYAGLRRGDHVNYVVQQPLVRLLDVAQAGEALGGDVHLPLMSLPGRLGIANVEGGRYLKPVHRLALQVPPGARAKVGLVWRAKANWKEMTTDETLHGLAKSMPFEILLELARLKGVALYGLQHGSADIEEAGAQHLVVDLGRKIADFADLASFVAQMDCLVSVDTAPAHLAGALGVPVVVALHHGGAWQWGTGDRSPWYDSARIVRQSVAGTWPMDKIVAEVEECLTTGTSPS